MRPPPLTPQQIARAKAAYARLHKAGEPWIPTYVMVSMNQCQHMADVPDGPHRQAAIIANGAILRMMRFEELEG